MNPAILPTPPEAVGTWQDRGERESWGREQSFQPWSAQWEELFSPVEANEEAQPLAKEHKQNVLNSPADIRAVSSTISLQTLLFPSDILSPWAWVVFQSRACEWLLASKQFSFLWLLQERFGKICLSFTVDTPRPQNMREGWFSDSSLQQEWLKAPDFAVLSYCLPSNSWKKHSLAFSSVHAYLVDVNICGCKWSQTGWLLFILFIDIHLFSYSSGAHKLK